jgi:hypothetical protein
MSRLFTLHEAEELLPAAEKWLRSAIESRKSLTEIDEQISSVLTRIALLGGVQLDVTEVAEMKSGKEQAAESLKQSLEEIAKIGVLVKDLDIGLLDFPTLLDGDEVYLCWKLGEPHIGFWHRTTEGFAGRKSIDQDFLERHRGSKPH